jgi:hypothetical protein
MVTFHPNHLDVALGIGEFSDVTEKLPVLFLQAPEVQIAENIAQQDKPSKGDRLQHS